jgi:hypothetical protein
MLIQILDPDRTHYPNVNIVGKSEICFPFFHRNTSPHHHIIIIFSIKGVIIVKNFNLNRIGNTLDADPDQDAESDADSIGSRILKQ